MALIYKGINLSAAGGTDSKDLKVSIDDTTADFLESKIVVGSTKLTKQTLDPGANETLELDVDETEIDHDALLNYEVDEHRPLDDASTTTTSLWSSDKIQTELDGKINAATPMTDNKIVKSVGTSGIDVEATGIDVDDLNNVTGINDLTIDGDLTVNGTTTTVSSTTLEVTDANVLVNNGGDQASADAQDAGLTVEMSDATDAIIGYDSTTTSKFKAGEVGSAHEIVTTNHSQTIINKTINVDNNTVSNIETDNLKAGVLETDLNNVVDNTKLAGAQAIKDYVAQEIATKDEASEISYDNTTSGLTATDVQAAIDETEGRLDTAESTLATHIGAGSGKHAASQITNTPAGNIAATDVQAAINELDTEKYAAADFDSDFDTRLATKTTDDLTEGTNEYYTTEKAQDAVGLILTDTASVDFNYDDTTPQITATVLPAGVDHDSLNNYVAAEHVDHNTVSITGSGGLGGGGTIAANRSLNLDFTNLASETSIEGVDQVAIYDDSAGAHRKVPMSSITGANDSAGDLNEGSFALTDSASGASVTGFAFANADVRSFEALVSVEIDADTDLFEQFEIEGVQRGADWNISISSLGDESLVEFDISAAGQITYSSGSYTGFVSGTIKYRKSD